MGVCACVHVCMCLYAYVCMHVCVCVCVCLCLHVSSAYSRFWIIALITSHLLVPDQLTTKIVKYLDTTGGCRSSAVAMIASKKRVNRAGASTFPCLTPGNDIQLTWHPAICPHCSLRYIVVQHTNNENQLIGKVVPLMQNHLVGTTVNRVIGLLSVILWTLWRRSCSQWMMFALAWVSPSYCS